MKPDGNQHIASRFVEMRLAVKESSALLNMYMLTNDINYLDEAAKRLGEFDESSKLPRIPHKQRDAEDKRRYMRDYQREKKWRRLEQEKSVQAEHICEHLLPPDLCHVC